MYQPFTDFLLISEYTNIKMTELKQWVQKVMYNVPKGIF